MTKCKVRKRIVICKCDGNLKKYNFSLIFTFYNPLNSVILLACNIKIIHMLYMCVSNL
jgi:hypothetical protein